MKIAVVDEGVIPIFKDELNIIEDLMVNSENSVVNRPDDVQVVTDHGLNVCKIINMYAPEAEIISIRIFNSLEMKANIKTLIAAFTYCLENSISIIHLSGGTVNLFDDYLLRGVIKRIINNNQIIVAAHSNTKGLSFPAIYPYVFSVRAGELFNLDNDVENRWGYNFTRSSKHKVNINENLNYITQIANSYAAPVLTANIYNIINSKNDNKISTILSNLGITDNIFLCEMPFFIDNVTIINLGNEVILEEVLSFEVKSIYDDTISTLDGEDYIFIPHENKKINLRKFKGFINALPVNHSKVRIVYLGIIDSNIKSIMAHYPLEFWLLPIDEIYPISISDTDLSNCATIYFQGNKELVYYIMAHLKDVFLEDGFNCIAISDYLEATLYGIYYFKDLANSIRRQQLEYVLEPDVELVYSKDESFRQISDSMLIEVLKERDGIKLLISVGNNNDEIDIYGEEDIKNLFSRIKRMAED